MNRAAMVVLVALAASAWRPAAARATSGAARPVKPSMQRPRLPPAPAWQPPVPATTTTESGARVVVLRDARLPLAHVVVTVAAGSALDPPGRPGLAAAVASMLQDGGAGARTAPAVAEALGELGAELRETIEPDEIELELTVLAPNLDRALALLGDLVARPRFDAVEWQRAQARRLAEIARRRADRADIADDTLLRALYGDHPYAHMPLGTAASVGAIGVAELHDFYRRHYGPRTVGVIVTGDAELPAVTASVTRALAGWQSSAAPPPPPPSPTVTAATATAGDGKPTARIVVVDQPGAPQSELRVGWIGRPRATPDFPSLLVLRMVLGGSFTSRLNQNLRETHGYTYGATAHFDYWRAPGPFRAQAAVRTDATAAALGEMVHELAAMRAPLSAAELQKARALVLAAVVEAFSDGDETASYLADLVAHDLAPDGWSRLPSLLAALDASSLAAVARALFAPPRLTVVVVGDRRLVDAPLRALPLPATIEYRDADGKLVE